MTLLATSARAMPIETTAAATRVDRARPMLATSSAVATVRRSLPRARLAGGVKPADLMVARMAMPGKEPFGQWRFDKTRTPQRVDPIGGGGGTKPAGFRAGGFKDPG